jgi:hypothetical protein
MTDIEKCADDVMACATRAQVIEQLRAHLPPRLTPTSRVAA